MLDALTRGMHCQLMLDRQSQSMILRIYMTNKHEQYVAEYRLTQNIIMDMPWIRVKLVFIYYDNRFYNL